MKVIICGDRYWDNEDLIFNELSNLPEGTIVVHGGAKGADTIGGMVAMRLGFEVRVYPAEWERYGRAAGIIRNSMMLEEKPDLILAFHSNIEKSKGTKDMINKGSKAGIEVKLIKG